jgi:hypothetical protein
MANQKFIPFDPLAREAFISFVCRHYGDALAGREHLLENNDGLEELAFRIACGELDSRS